MASGWTMRRKVETAPFRLEPAGRPKICATCLSPHKSNQCEAEIEMPKNVPAEWSARRITMRVCPKCGAAGKDGRHVRYCNGGSAKPAEVRKTLGEGDRLRARVFELRKEADDLEARAKSARRVAAELEATAKKLDAIQAKAG